ncbi:MAG: hypothetical protein JW724_00650 [Candidatus Altiarchaeota archaeon]|nr:hypothetical protein [Candidatus Altiarchaeota archaeon]
MTDSDDQLLERVVRETGKTSGEIREKVDKRKAATHGLLSDYGALYAVAKELGLDIGAEKSAEKIKVTKLSEIRVKSAFNIVGKVKTVSPPKEFQRKDGGTGKLASAILMDNSGEARLVLWDNHAEIASRLKRGDVILVRNGYGKTGLNGSAEINAGSMSGIVVNPKMDADLPDIKSGCFKIGDLTKDESSVDMVCRVNATYPVTGFTRSDGSGGLRASFIAQDDTGTIRVVLWGDAAKTPLERGDFVRIENAYTKEGLNQELELHVGGRSAITKTEETIDLEKLPETKDLPVGEITPGMSGISTAGRVIRVYSPRPYSNGMLASLMLGDLSGTVRVVLWNEKSEMATELQKGDPIRIRNAYSKAGLNNEPEVHIGKYGEIIVNQDLEMPPLKDIQESLQTEKKIIDLQDNDRYVKITGRVVDLDEGRRITYMTCSKCGKRVQSMGDIWFCETCSEEAVPSTNLRVSLVLEDDTGSIKVVGFRANAEKILGMDVEEVMNIIGETQDELEPLRQVRDGLINKTLTLLGRVRYSDFSDQLEFMVEEADTG